MSAWIGYVIASVFWIALLASGLKAFATLRGDQNPERLRRFTGCRNPATARILATVSVGLGGAGIVYSAIPSFRGFAESLILVAFVVQASFFAANRLAAAVWGAVVATITLLSGLSEFGYWHPTLHLFGLKVSKAIFVSGCGLWYLLSAIFFKLWMREESKHQIPHEDAALHDGTPGAEPATPRYLARIASSTAASAAVALGIAFTAVLSTLFTLRVVAPNLPTTLGLRDEAMFALGFGLGLWVAIILWLDSLNRFRLGVPLRSVLLVVLVCLSVGVGFLIEHLAK